MPAFFWALFLSASFTSMVAFTDGAPDQGAVPSVPNTAARLPGMRQKQTHRMSPWQTPMQSAKGSNFPPIQAKCGDDLRFFWNAEKHGLFLIPTAVCPELFIDASAAGIMELMPVTTEGNVTIELDEPGRFWFADPLYCRSHNMSVEVQVRCQNELPRFSDHGLRSWGDESSVVTHSPPPEAPTTDSVSKSLSNAIPKAAPAPRWDVKAAEKFPEQIPGLDAFMYRR